MDDQRERTALEPRRIPTQERSRQRVDGILDAVAELLVERGFDAVTTDLIAEKAGIPVGSIYQFFPNKFAIFYALTVRYIRQINAIASIPARRESLDLPWEEVVDRTIEAEAELWSNEQALSILWAGVQMAPELKAAVAESDKKSEDYLLTGLNRILPNVDPARRRLAARVIVHMTRYLLDLSIAEPSEENQRVVGELKVAVKSYLRHLMEP
jgi:AcrR family transcriptional regulator